MPAYELSVVVRHLPRQDLVSALKRIGKLVLDQGCVLQKIENHGTKDLPYVFIRRHQKFTKGSYFVFHFMSSPGKFPAIHNECLHDVDLIRHGIANKPGHLNQECTLEEELKPPAERESVKKMLEAGEKAKIKSKPYNKFHRDYKYFDIYM